jgi:hypothetical protein
VSYDSWKQTDPADSDPYLDTDCRFCGVRDGYACVSGCDCPDCVERAEREDNYEPPEPDGEAFRGGEAAAYEAETQARIQRELK